ncbi:hypothetical protein [Micromonospora sp. NPDC005211]|uniref:hypothetical protein n=1 Tax=unclassified Micromonospora TaxID=2617518 RepID=UPI0033AD95A0
MRETFGAALGRQRIALAVALIAGWLTAVVDLRAGEAGGPVTLVRLVPLAVFFGVALRELRRPLSTAELRVDEESRAFFAPPRAGVSFLTVLVGFTFYREAVTADSPGRNGWDSLLAAFFLACAIVFIAVSWFRVPGSS